MPDAAAMKFIPQPPAEFGEGYTRGFAAGVELGFATGQDLGYRRGLDDEACAWQEIVTGFNALADQPRIDELERLRQPTNEPCPAAPIPGHRCSRCVRAAAVALNMVRYGQPDFPGVGKKVFQ